MTRWNNHLKTIVLLGALSALLVAIGGVLAPGRLPIFVLLAAVMNLGAYFFSDRLVLRMHGARELPADAAPALHQMVRELAVRAEIPTPRLFLIDDPQPNAFATGRSPKHGAVAVTQGLLARSREYLADETGARISGDPLALARALRRLESAAHVVPSATARPATASLFITNPFAGGARFARLFSTHPSTDERIARLEALAGRRAA